MACLAPIGVGPLMRLVIIRDKAIACVAVFFLATVIGMTHACLGTIECAVMMTVLTVLTVPMADVPLTATLGTGLFGSTCHCRSHEPAMVRESQ